MPCKAGKLGCALGVLTLALNLSTAVCAAVDNSFSAVPGSFKATTDVDTGAFSSPRMAVDIVLTPRNESELSNLLTILYDTKSANYHHWLGNGEFYSRFAPSQEQAAAVANYLRESGLDVEKSSSPFLLRVSGPSSMIEATFRTTLRNYRNPKGVAYYSNASEIHMPKALASQVLGAIGLSNTVRFQSQVVRPAREAEQIGRAHV